MIRVSICVFLLTIVVGCNHPPESTSSTAPKSTNGTTPVTKSSPPGEDAR
jgi:hypothetical protein